MVSELLGRIPRGGGWRIHGRPARPSTHRTRKAAIGYTFVHSATAWLHLYNHHRHHTAIGGPPLGRVSNLVGHCN